MTPTGDAMAKDENLRAIYDGVIEAVKESNLAVGLTASICKDIERSKPAMLRCYDNIRAYTKTKYMQDADGRLDRHKVIACVMSSVLLGLNLSDSEKVEGGKFLKERLAIKIGLSLLRTWITRDNEDFKNGKIIAFLDERGGLVLPPPICDNKPYDKNWVLELHYNQQAAKEHNGNLPILSMSDKLFLIESYNRALAGI